MNGSVHGYSAVSGSSSQSLMCVASTYSYVADIAESKENISFMGNPGVLILLKGHFAYMGVKSVGFFQLDQ